MFQMSENLSCNGEQKIVRFVVTVYTLVSHISSVTFSLDLLRFQVMVDDYSGDKV